MLFLLLLAALTGCTTKKTGALQSEDITVFNNIVFSLSPEDTISNITPEIRDRYLQMLHVGRIQVPLYRYIRSDDYELFLGIPVNTSIKEFYSLREAEKNENAAIDKASLVRSIITDSLSYLYTIRDGKSEKIYHEYLATFDDNLVYVLGVYTMTGTTCNDSLLSYTALSKRLMVK